MGAVGTTISQPAHEAFLGWSVSPLPLWSLFPVQMCIKCSANIPVWAWRSALDATAITEALSISTSDMGAILDYTALYAAGMSDCSPMLKS